MTSRQVSQEQSPTRQTISIRGGLLLAFALVVLLVSGSLLTASLLGTAHLARDVAGSLMFALGRDTEVRLEDLFDPIRQKLTEDYAAIRQGRYSASDARTRRELLMPGLFSLPKVDSMMLADQKGGHFLVLRYSESVRQSALLAAVSDRLPAFDSGRLQFLTRDFQPAERGETSHWALWEDAGRQLVQEWDLALSGYDGRKRPWYQAAMAAFRDRTLPEAQAAASSLVAWTDVYPLFTSKAPSISAAVAARDPSGEILIVTYDLPLDEVAQFTTSVRPSPRGQMFVMTDDGRLLGPPRDSRTENKSVASVPSLQPVAQAGFPNVAKAVSQWKFDHGRRPDHFRLGIDGEAWWAGFTPFQFGSGHQFWIGILLPESDLIPAARHNQWLIVGVGLLALLGAALLALRLARWFSKPLAELAAQSRRIASLDLTETTPVHSPLTELDLLSVTLGSMRAALNKHISEQRDAAARQRALEEQLREAQKLEAVGLLAGGIAHDFNNLLQAIGGNAELALGPFSNSQDRNAAIGEIVKAVDRASQLTRQLLAFGRRQALQRENVELNDLVAAHLAMIRRLIPENIHIDFRAAAQPVVAEADKGQLEQVLLNLCLNARDAMPGGGRLSIAIEAVVLDAATAEQLCQGPAGSFARITVSDTGQGMAPPVLERIFEPFFSTKSREKSYGLGLAVVYGIVRQHGGYVAASSNPGQGSEFRVLLPCAIGRSDLDPAKDTLAKAAPEKMGSITATILLAEDNEAVRKVAEKVLSRFGARVVVAVDGLQAVQRFTSDPGQFDLLFLDVMMPGLSGFQVAARCRFLRPDISVLFASGYAAESLDNKAEMTASDAILRKPYGVDELRVAVLEIMASRRGAT
jgi:signal transduction histidine kinase/ActR/RegA family two-component response regulator